MPNTQTSHLGAGTMRILVLALTYPHRASYYDDWRDALQNSPRFNSVVQNILGLRPSALATLIEDFDAIIVLHSCNSDTLEYLEPLAAPLAERQRAQLFVFIGNEYNSPYVSMARRIAFLRNSRANFAATQLLLEAGQYLYARAGCRVISVPHALNPIIFTPGRPHHERSLDIGVKGYRYPPYLGDDDRNTMLARVLVSARRLNLITDISEDARLSRDEWAAFLGTCQGTISTETGSWYIAPDDALMDDIHAYLRTKDRGLTLRNDGALRRAVRRLPVPVKSALWTLLKKGPVKFEMFEDFKTTFAELDEHFFRHHARAPIYSKAISSRHFDAIGKKTCQIMLAGRYNDILIPGLHYIAVSRDFSDVDNALEQFKDPNYSTRIADEAYDFVMQAHTYAHRAQTIYDLLSDS